MKKVAIVLMLTFLAVVIAGCGGTASQTSGSSYGSSYGSNYNSNPDTYK
ncbi:MAG: hypothetical protein LBQ83_05360 [Candidatus Margulisbacteria bacterium]|jgi:uncharacterized protein YceK|nr:hypothetical protein [Candidatus Margulisiibacteriota bacterium]